MTLLPAEDEVTRKLDQHGSWTSTELPWRIVAERPGGDDLVAAFTRWTAEQRAGAAATDRARERSLRDQARASATWIGTLVDLAEQATTVTAMVATQRRRGRIVGVGPDFCVFESLLGGPTLICLHAIAAVWPDPTPAGAGGWTGTATGTGSGPGPGSGHSAGDRGPALHLSLMAALSMLAEERSPVCLVTSTGDETTGELIAAGEDVLTLRSGPPDRRLAYVQLATVALCDLR